MPRRTLGELTRIAVHMVAEENLDADVPDDVSAQRILGEADPSFVEELGRPFRKERELHLATERADDKNKWHDWRPRAYDPTPPPVAHLGLQVRSSVLDEV